jgi:hypothetical protein
MAAHRRYPISAQPLVARPGVELISVRLTEIRLERKSRLFKMKKKMMTRMAILMAIVI